MSENTGQSLLRRVLATAGDTWIGCTLIALIVVCLGAASLAPARMAGGTSLYGHPLMLALWGLLCLNILAATLGRIPLDFARAGAWLSHAGALALAGGACWYALASVSGECPVTKVSGKWRSADCFYDKRVAAVYVGDGASQTPLNVDVEASEETAMVVPLAGSPEGVSLRVTSYRPHVALYRAVDLAVSDANGERSITLSAAAPYKTTLDTGTFLLAYHPGASKADIDDFLKTSGKPIPRDMLVVLTGEGVAPCLAHVRPDGSHEILELKTGSAVDVPVGGREVGLKLVREFLTAVAAQSGDPMAGPAVRVEADVAGRRAETWVPYANYEHLSEAVSLELPDGRSVRLNFSRLRRPLGAAVQVRNTAYQTVGGTNITKDYVCRISVGGHEQTLSLNNPLWIGPYKISHQTWLGDPRDPQMIVLAVASAPGLWLAWLGCGLIAIGMPYGFYVKPLILRRRVAK